MRFKKRNFYFHQKRSSSIFHKNIFDENLKTTSRSTIKNSILKEMGSKYESQKLKKFFFHLKELEKHV